MDVNENKTCPLCHNHCPLSNPRCRRGMRYAQGADESGESGFDGRERPQPQEPEQDDSLIAKLRRCTHYLRQLSESSGSQLRVLEILARQEQLSQRELIDLVGVQPGSLSELLGKLEGKGYIQRSKNESDRRNVDIRLTELGREVLSQARERHGAASENLFTALSEEEEDLLGAILDKLLQSWKEAMPEAGPFGEGRGFHSHGSAGNEEQESHGGHGNRGGREGFRPEPGGQGQWGRGDREPPFGGRHDRGRGRDR